MIGLTNWLAWGLCGALVPESTYLTASESWEVTYKLGPDPNCPEVEVDIQNQTNLELVYNLVQVLWQDNPDCVIELWVDAQSNVTYPGIVIDDNGDRRPAAAVGSETAAKIFGMSPNGYWRIAVDPAQFGSEFAIRAGLDQTVPTFEKPADIDSWTRPMSQDFPPNEVNYSNIPESMHGPFQIASLDHGCREPRCVTKSRKLEFYTVLRQETDFISARNAWTVRFDVIPLCSGYSGQRVSCEKLETFAEVESCLAPIRNCAVEILATLRQAKAYHGLVYDSNSSTTPGARIGVGAIQRLLRQFKLGESWRLIEVGFEGKDYSDELETGACLRGSLLAFRASDPAAANSSPVEDLLPSDDSPVNFDGWMNKDQFRFVEGKIEYESVLAPGLFRNVVQGSTQLYMVDQSRVYGTAWDIDVAVQQERGQPCHWRQTGCTVKLSFPAGNKEKSDYLKEKNNWSIRYVVVTGDNCQGVTLPYVCSDVAAGGAILRSCVEEIGKIHPTCRFDIKVELNQTIGFDGMVVGKEGNSAPIIAIGQNITSKAFTSPLKDHPFIYLRDVTWEVDIQGTGDDGYACDERGSKGRMVFRNFLAGLPTPQNPASLSDGTWRDAPFFKGAVQPGAHQEYDQQVVAALNPMADFSLSAHLVPGRGCVTRQQGAQLQLVIPVRRNSGDFIHAAETWRIEYGIRGTRDCSYNRCTLTPGTLTPGGSAGFRACAKIISWAKPNCRGNITIWAHQDIVYPGLVNGSGSVGAFAITPAAVKQIQQVVELYPMTRISLDFGGRYLGQDCNREQSEPLFIPEYNNPKLDLNSGTDADLYQTDNGMFTAKVDDYPASRLQAGTYLLRAPRSDCQWSTTAARIFFEPSEEVDLDLFTRN